MSKKFILFSLAFTILFLTSTSETLAEDSQAELNTGSKVSIEEAETRANEQSREAAEEKARRTSVVSQNQVKSQTLQELKTNRELKVQELLKKKTELIAKKEERTARLQSEKIERKTEIEELKAKQEVFKQNRETLKASFDEMKLQKLENIKQRGLLVSARYTAISQALYKMLQRMNNIIAEKKEAGFDVSTAENSLSAIELKLADIQGQQESIQSMIDGLESLSAEEIPSALTEIKNISITLKSQFEAIRTDMKQLVQSLK